MALQLQDGLLACRLSQRADDVSVFLLSGSAPGILRSTVPLIFRGAVPRVV